MAKIGRPVEYDPTIVDRIPDMFKEGQSITEVATELGISRDTLYRWAKEHEDFSDAIELGKQLSQSWWERQGREGLYKTSEYDGESKTSSSRSMNEKVWAKNMSCRFPNDWREEKNVNLTGGVEITRILDDVPKEKKE